MRSWRVSIICSTMLSSNMWLEAQTSKKGRNSFKVSWEPGLCDSGVTTSNAGEIRVRLKKRGKEQNGSEIVFFPTQITFAPCPMFSYLQIFLDWNNPKSNLANAFGVPAAISVWIPIAVSLLWGVHQCCYSQCWRNCLWWKLRESASACPKELQSSKQCSPFFKSSIKKWKERSAWAIPAHWWQFRALWGSLSSSPSSMKMHGLDPAPKLWFCFLSSPDTPATLVS